MQYAEGQLERLQAVELDMLLELSRVCAELNVEWFLDSGTALGAARHEGFIPWDDDVDVGMMRADYDRFLEQAPALLPGNFKVCTPQNTEGYAPLFAKVMRTDTLFATQETLDAGFRQGVFIDIFPYDALSADARVAQAQKRQCALRQKLSYLYHSANAHVPHAGVLGAAERFVCKVAHHIVRCLASPGKLAEGFDEWAQKGADDPSGTIAGMAYAQDTEMDESIIFPTATARFEGHELPVPGQLDAYLTRIYGDWRQLPPVEQRRDHAPLELVLTDPEASL